MKTSLPFLLFLAFFSSLASAQTDTVFFENFQLDIFPSMALMPGGNDSSWVNFDQDGMPTAFGTEPSKRWQNTQFYFQPVDPMTGETNYCAGSLSFLQNFLPGNRNWLILPPVQLVNNTYSLHWRSAPSQLPRYMDGYSVLVSSSSNQLTAFTDTLFQAASMDQITGNGQSLVLSNFTFTPGYVHANNMTLTDYFVPNAGATLASGKLEPNSVSLSSYSGKRIYIAFLHDSDDDDRIAIDDILIVRNSTVSAPEVEAFDFNLVAYPNPVDESMNVLFTTMQSAEAQIEIYDTQGRRIAQKNLGMLPEGEQNRNLQLGYLTAGQYFLQLTVGETVVTKGFVKR